MSKDRLSEVWEALDDILYRTKNNSSVIYGPVRAERITPWADFDKEIKDLKRRFTRKRPKPRHK